MSEAYELFGCGTDELYTIAVSGFGYDTDADLVAYWETHGINFRGISQDGGSGPIASTYNIGAYPTYILIAPNHDIVEQDMWPISNTTTFVNYFEGNGLTQAPCPDMAADFSVDAFDICEGGTANFTDESEGAIISWNWTFEGGNPATSTDPNPSVTYDAAGTYYVELTVTDGLETLSTLMEDYIETFEYPVVTQEDFGLVCVQWAPIELTGGLPEGGEYSGDYVTDGMFDPAAAGVGDHVITYTYANEAGCESYVEEILTVDACTGVDENAANSVKVYPNPTTDMINVKAASLMNSIQVFNHLGQLVLEKEVNANTTQIGTSEFKSGLYSIRLKTDNGYILKSVVVK